MAMALSPVAVARELSLSPVIQAPMTVTPVQRAAASPGIYSVMPNNLVQGQHYSLTINGHDLNSRIRLTMGEGLEVGIPTVIGTTLARVEVSVHAGASLGVHQVILIVGNQRFNGPASVIVSSAAQAPVGVQSTVIPSSTPAAPPTGLPALPPLGNVIAEANVGNVSPGQWVIGQKYGVTLFGQGFVPGMEVNFGQGVKLLSAGQKPVVLNANLARIDIEVLDDALPGLRQISLRTTPQQSWRVATAKVWVLPVTHTYSSNTGAFPAPRFLPITQKLTFKKGVIELKTPWWQLASGELDQDEVSLLDDDVVFTWQEKNPGAANYYELRVMDMSGKVLLTKRIELRWQGKYLPPPTYYHPDAAFLNALLNPQVGPDKPTLKKIQLGQSTKQYPAGSNLLWEVAGYRVYSSDGVAPASKTAMLSEPVHLAAALGTGAKTMTDVGGSGVSVGHGMQMQAKPEPVELEVEISDRWPLKRPNRPNGFGACPLSGQSSGLSLFNRDRGTGDTEVNAVSYIGDTMQLTGHVDLSMSPYASHPQETQYVYPTSSSQTGQDGSMPFVATDPNKQVTDHRFDNLFVDWGDGVVEPMDFKAGTPGADHGATFGRDETLVLPSADDYTKSQEPGAQSTYPEFFTHVYKDTDAHTIRVYQLSEGDVQHVNPSQLEDAYNTSQGGSDLYSRLIQGGMQGGNSAKDIAGRAYVLYCHEVQMQPYKDPVAYGPLQLQSVNIVGFGAPKTSQGGRTARISSAQKIKSGSAVSVVKPGVSVQGVAAQGQIKLSAKPGIAAASSIKAVSDVDAVCSGCNKAFTAHAVLDYLGDKGTIKTVWKVQMQGGSHRARTQSFPGVGSADVPRSPAREGDPHDWGEPQPGHFDLYSPPLPVDPASVYKVWVEVSVGPEEMDNSLLNAVGSMRLGMAPGALANLKGRSKQRFGILRPTREGIKAAPAVAYVSGAALSAAASHLTRSTWGVAGKMSKDKGALVQGAMMLKMPPFFVQSDQKKYRVEAIDPNKPCQLAFAGQGSDVFSIYLDQQNLPQDGGGTYSGTGTLNLKLAVGDGAAMDIPATIDFQNWKVDLAGHVASGTTLKRNVTRTISVPGMTGQLVKLDGVAGQKMDATLDLDAGDSEFRVPGSNAPIHWQATAPLRANGDWTAPAKVVKADLGWTGFVLHDANDVTLDISNSDGNRPGTCAGGSGTGWVGVKLGAAKVALNTLDMADVQVPVTDWGITGGHLCGQLDRVNDPSLKNLPIDKGTVSFDRIRFKADSQGMSANYSFSAHLPWLEADLHADDVPLLPGKTTFDFAGVKPSSNVARDFGPMHFDVAASSFRFGQDPSGWRAIADPVITFKSEGKPFMSAPLQVPDMRFGMNGRAWFNAQGASSRNIPLSGTAMLGKTAFDLNSVKLTSGSGGGDPLDAAFHGKLNLSKALPAADVQVDYRISDQYQGSGPVNAPFTVKTVLPLGQPTTEVSINPVYSPVASETRYSGAVDLALFGGPPVKGEFLLGYQGSNDYWLTRVNIPLSSSGVTLVPPFLNLYKIHGGLGYHMALNAFQDAGTLANAQPDTSQGSLLMVGMRVGSPDKFAYMLDGDFTVSPATSGGRMDFHAWLLSTQHTGNGDFQGFFQFAGGNFDGRLWGHLGMLNDAVSFDLGNSAGNAAVDLHFGGGWYLYAGKNTGPRIKAKVLVSDTDSYLMLGSDVGLAMGGAQHIHLGVGSSSVASAYVDGYMDMGLQVTPQPKVKGDFGAGAEAGVCVVGGCESMSVTAAVHAEALPVEVRAHATVEFPWPLPDVGFDVHM